MMAVKLHANMLCILVALVLGYDNIESQLSRPWANYTISTLQYCIHVAYDSVNNMLMCSRLLKKCVRKTVLSVESCISQRPSNQSNLIHRVDEMKHLCRVFSADPNDGLRVTWLQSSFKGKQLSQTQQKPMGRECIAVYYKTASGFTTFINEKIAGNQTVFDKIRYIFFTSILFNLNITFNEFTLSDMCIMHHPYKFKFWIPGKEEFCAFHVHTEYVLIHQNEEAGEEFARKLYFCMRRPLWSIFTKHQTHIDYYICRICLNYHSQIIFTYQVTNHNTITLQDRYRLLAHGTHLEVNMHFALEYKYETPAPFSISCVNLKYICATYVYNYDIRGNKYEFISIWQTGDIKDKVFLLSNLNHNEVLLKIKQNIARTIPFFYCTIQLKINYVKTNGIKVANTLKFLLQEVKSHELSATDKIISFSSVNYNCKLCQKVIVLGSQITNYAVIDIINMTFIGWRTYLCLHGGISFYEFSDNATKHFRKNMVQTYREIYNLCNNYTGKFNKSGLSFTLNNISKNLIGSYTTSSHRTLIVIYFQNNDFMEINFKISPTKCRGVFGNICSSETFPFNYWKKRVHYQYPFNDNTNNSCVTFQMGSQFLFTKLYYKPLYIKGICFKKINLKQNHEWCGAHLSLYSNFRMPKYIIPRRAESRESIEMFFKNSLENFTRNIFRQKIKQCNENILKKLQYGMRSKDWRRGLSIFSVRGELNSSSIHNFKTFQQVKSIHMTVASSEHQCYQNLSLFLILHSSNARIISKF